MLNRLMIPVLFQILFLWGQGGKAQDTIDLYQNKKGALVCWTETRTEPRPLKIYFLKLDLSCTDLELYTLPGADPDGDGPAESTLTLPGDLFTTFHALAAINASAFAGLPGTENDIRGWYKNRPVDIQGMVVADGKVISPAKKGRTAFWTDKSGHPKIGDPQPGDHVWQAVADWSGRLIFNNQIIADPTVTTLHPRSGAGFDDAGKWLILMVVDGRQPGFSEGVSLYELARLFQSKGCSHAINLDGGGSSIMLISNGERSVKTVNSPSGLVHRPIPVMLGIRKVN